LLKKYGKGRERKTKIDSFESVVASEVMINNQKLYVNYNDGFAGYGLKKDEFLCECSDLDEIIVFRGDGTMIVAKVDEKKYVGKDIRHIALFRKTEPEQVYNMVYQDGRGGNAMVKRFTVGGTTRDKEYVLTKGSEGSKVLYFSLTPNPSPKERGASPYGVAEIIHVKLRPKPKLRKTEFEFDLNSIEVKGRGSMGNILSRNLVAKITKGGAGKVSTASEQLTIAPVEKKVAEVKRIEGKPEVEKKKIPVAKAVATKKVTPIKAKAEEKPVTMEWDFSSKEKVNNERARILAELEKKAEQKKKAQTKMNF
jgi:topoisomerase-4 subunit A